MNKQSKRAREALDERLSELRPVSRYATPQKGWIRAIRDALGMTRVQLAKRMDITPQSLLGIEESEAQGSVRLDTLRKAAEALDCTLVHVLVPNKPLAEQVDNRARQVALRAIGGVAHSMAIEDQAARADLEERIADFISTSLRDRDLWDDP